MHLIRLKHTGHLHNTVNTTWKLKNIIKSLEINLNMLDSSLTCDPRNLANSFWDLIHATEPCARKSSFLQSHFSHSKFHSPFAFTLLWRISKSAASQRRYGGAGGGSVTLYGFYIHTQSVIIGHSVYTVLHVYLGLHVFFTRCVSFMVVENFQFIVFMWRHTHTGTPIWRAK